MANVFDENGKLIECSTTKEDIHLKDELYALKKANEILEMTLFSVSKDRDNFKRVLQRLTKHVGPGWRKVAKEALK